MEKHFFNYALKELRGNESLEELHSDVKEQYCFFDSNKEELYFLNNISNMNISELCYTYREGAINWGGLISMIKKLDIKLTSFIKELIIVVDDEDVEYFEEKYNREFSYDYLGFAGAYDRVVVINLRHIMYLIMQKIDNNNYYSEVDFKTDVIGNVVTTLLHELAHISAGMGWISEEFNVVGDDTEEDVERYALEYFKSSIKKDLLNLNIINEEFLYKYFKDGESMFSDSLGEILIENN